MVIGDVFYYHLAGGLLRRQMSYFDRSTRCELRPGADEVEVFVCRNGAKETVIEAGRRVKSAAARAGVEVGEWVREADRGPVSAQVVASRLAAK